METAIPTGATIRYKQHIEPKWDSCDGRKGTFGWDDVAVNDAFDTSLPTRLLLARADHALRAAGWHRDPTSTPDNPVWSRTVSTGVAHAALSLGPASGWELFASAPPRGTRTSGC